MIGGKSENHDGVRHVMGVATLSESKAAFNQLALVNATHRYS